MEFCIEHFKVSRCHVLYDKKCIYVEGFSPEVGILRTWIAPAEKSFERAVSVLENYRENMYSLYFSFRTTRDFNPRVACVDILSE